MQARLGDSEVKRRKGKVFVINAPRYMSEYQYIEPKLQFFLRRHEWMTSVEVTEGYGDQWLLFIGNPRPGQVALKSGGEWYSASGPMMAFFPKFSLAHWRVEKGSHIWGAFRSDFDDPRLPKSPTIYEWGDHRSLSSFEDICNTLKNLTNYHQVVPAQEPTLNAKKIKSYLDAKFTEDKTIPQVAIDLGMSYSSLTHTFRKYFEISPTEYRAQLRLFSSISRILNDGMSVTESCYANGHSDFSSFYRKFKKSFLAKPNQFVWQKRDLTAEALSIEAPIKFDEPGRLVLRD